jgi:hypothetical protein
MSNDQWDDEDWNDDEDWQDDGEEEPDEEAAAACPECGGPVHSMTEKCPACGYWLSDADREAMWRGTSRPRWQKATAVVIIAAFVITLLLLGWTLF